MNFTDYLFYLVSAIILVSAGAAVFTLRTQTALRSVVTVLATVTILFFYLGSDYAAILHLSIFVFGALGLLIFAFLKTGLFKETFERGGSLISIMISAVFTALLAGTLISSKWQEIPPDKPALSAGEITSLINSEYLLPLFVTAVILFLGILGTSYLSRKN